MHRRQLTAAIVLLLLLMAGCGGRINNDGAQSAGGTSVMKVEDIPAAESVQELTKICIDLRYESATSISLDEYKEIDNIGYLFFSFSSKERQYFGFTMAVLEGKLWRLSYFEEYPNDARESVALVQFLGSYPGGANMVVHITLGHINDTDIREVTLHYPKADIQVVHLDAEQRSFSDIRINVDDSLSQIECKTAGGKIVYQKKFE